MGEQHRLICSAACCVGNIRINNEDNFYLAGTRPSDKELNAGSSSIIRRNCVVSRGVFCVCDGVGGEEQGELASAITIDTLDKVCDAHELAAKGAPAKIASDVIEQASQAVRAKAGELDLSFIGTTLALVIVTGGKAFAANVGDSRIYLIRSGNITRLSHDHTRRQYYIDLGLMRSDEPAGPLGHELTSCIGLEAENGVPARHFARPVELEKGDVIIICSDGLTDMLTEKEILSRVLSIRSHPEISSTLVNAALRAGGADNVTVVGIYVA